MCTAKARAAVAGFLGVGDGSITDSSTISSGGEPTCNLFMTVSKGRKVTTSVNVERTPQAYFLLERTIEEAAQVFTGVRMSPAPDHIAHLGIDASWFPAEQHVMTTDGVRLITATVVWPSVKTARKRALAVVAARAYLGALDYKAVDLNY